MRISKTTFLFIMKTPLFFLIGFMLSAQLFAQSEITGQVTDENGEPLAGASVILIENNKGTATNENGVYLFEGLNSGEYHLRVSFVGYESETRKTKIPEGFERGILHIQMLSKIVGLNDVVVSATRAGSKAPFSYSNIQKEELERNNLGQDVPFLLRWTPSAVVNSDAGAGIGYTGIRIRGTDPTRINVTINGIPLNDAESQGVFWVDLPDFVSSTENIQIQRGVGTSTNGAGAFGATINLNTTTVHEQAYAAFGGTLGSFNTWKSNVQFGSGLLNQKFTLDGRLSKIHSDGYIDRAEVDLESFFFSAAYLGKKSAVRFNLFSGHEVTYQAWNGVPVQYANDDELRKFNVSGIEKTNGAPHDNEVDDYTQTHAQLVFNHQFNRNWNLNLAAHYTHGEGFFEQYKALEDFSDYGLNNIPITQGDAALNIALDSLYGAYTDERINLEVDSVFIFTEAPPWEDTIYQITASYNKTDLIRRRWLDNDFYGATWALNYIRNDNRMQVTFGGGWHQYTGDHFGEIIWADLLPAGTEPNHRYYFGTGEKTDFNVFGKLSYDLGASLTSFLDLQYRSVDYEITGTDNDRVDLSTSDNLGFFNPKFGLFYDLKSNTKLYASVAIANREPNRGDYKENRKQGLENPKPETLLNTEVGLRHSWRKAMVNVNFYHMNYKDQLVLTGQVNDVGGALKTNVPTSYRMGVEVAGGLDVAKKLKFEGNLTLSQNKIKSFTEYRDNWDTGIQDVIEHGETDIAFSPNIIASGVFTFDSHNDDNYHIENRLSISLSGKYVGKQFIDNTSNDKSSLPAYFFSDLSFLYCLNTKFAKTIEFKFLIRNLLNNKFSSNAWTYRFQSAFYNPVPDDPYAVAEGDGVYNLTGLFPQAGINFLTGINLKF